MSPAQMRAAEMQMFDNEFLMRTPIGEGLLRDPLAMQGMASLGTDKQTGLLRLSVNPKMAGTGTLGRAVTGPFNSFVEMTPERFADEQGMTETLLHEWGHLGSDNLRLAPQTAPEIRAFEQVGDEARQRLRDVDVRGRTASESLAPAYLNMGAERTGATPGDYATAARTLDEILSARSLEWLANRYPGRR